MSLQDDTPGAHTKADLRGPPVLLELPKNFWPAEWSKFRKPVMKLVKALYGLPRAGLGWGIAARNRLAGAGFTHVRDICDGSMFVKGFPDGNVVVVLYTDGLAISGCRKRALEARVELRKALGIPGKGGLYEELKDFIGVSRVVLFRSKARVALMARQTSYAASVIESFERNCNGGRKLAAVSTPMKVRFDEHGRAMAEFPWLGCKLLQ